MKRETTLVVRTGKTENLMLDFLSKSYRLNRSALVRTLIREKFDERRLQAYGKLDVMAQAAEDSRFLDMSSASNGDATGKESPSKRFRSRGYFECEELAIPAASMDWPWEWEVHYGVEPATIRWGALLEDDSMPPEPEDYPHCVEVPAIILIGAYMYLVQQKLVQWDLGPRLPFEGGFPPCVGLIGDMVQIGPPGTYSEDMIPLSLLREYIRCIVLKCFGPGGELKPANEIGKKVTQ